MGTNYYVTSRKARKEYEQETVKVVEDVMKNAIEMMGKGNIRETLDNILYSISEVKRQEPESVHIGKSSCGWKFLFATNPTYYNMTRDSIDAFLRNSDSIIETEYGETITPDEFWEMVDSKKDGYTSTSYYLERKIEGDTDYIYQNNETITDEGLRFETSGTYFS